MLTAEDFQPSLDLSEGRVVVDADSRRIAVRVANFGEVHSGFGEEVKVPRNTNVDAAHVGTALLADGSSTRVAVLPMHTTHAPTRLDALHAASWYENSGKGVARGRYSVDDSGIRFDGQLFDDITEAQLERLTASSASGDWRAAIAIKKFSDFEKTPCDFVGSCIVNIPGYSDTFTPKKSERFALVASAAGDLMSIETVPAFSLTAASVGRDGLSESDIRDAWRESYPESMTPGVDEPYTWVEEIYLAPQKIIVSTQDGHVEVPWAIAPDSMITFGDQTPVEKIWVPVEGNTVDTTPTANNTLNAGGKGCEGDCGTCDGSCGDAANQPAEETVTLSASALANLLEVAQSGGVSDGHGVESSDQDAAYEAATAALIAGGHMEAPDPQAERMARLESMVIEQAFRD